MTTKKQPMPDLVPLVTVIEEEKARFAERTRKDKFRAEVRQILDSRVNEVIAQFLGFKRDRWNGKWEVDSCNGRAGESLIGGSLKGMAKDIIEDWLEEHIDDFREVLEKQLKSAVTDWFKGSASYETRRAVQKRMEGQLHEELTEYLKDDSVAALISLLKIGESGGN